MTLLLTRNRKSQYERQFKKWGFRKNKTLPRKIDWEFVGRRVDKRKRIGGKDSELVVDNGDPWPPAKLRRTLYGQAFVPTHSRFSRPGGEFGSSHVCTAAEIADVVDNVGSSFPNNPRGHCCPNSKIPLITSLV
jgi:hypothetical protein